MSVTADRIQPIPLGPRNALLKRLRRLSRQTKVRSSERAFVVDGPTLVTEALASPLTVEAVYAGAVDGLDMLAGELDRTGSVIGNVPVYSADDEVLMSLLDPANPRPVAAVVGTPSFSLADITPDGPLLAAVELRDPGNLGTVIRTAEAAAFGGVVVVGQSVDHLSPKTVRASAGSILRLPVVTLPAGPEALDAIRDGGWTVVATVVDPSAPAYDRLDLTSSAILVGNEPHGLDAALIDGADAVITIPMADGVESLNVGAAAAVLAFEAARQLRNLESSGPKSP